MCGIGGIIQFKQDLNNLEPLKRISVALKHRGPDGEGMYVDKKVGFIHRRLAILDYLGGHQPFIFSDFELALSYNGEVYNYKEIASELKIKPATNSDTEVVLLAYQQYGIHFLNKLRGMFAFALYDGLRGKVYLVRDRIGIKPLYYYKDEEKIIFASELDALIKSELIDKTISKAALGNYFRLQYVPGAQSIYENIYKLPAANYLEIDVNTGECKQVCYWNLQPMESYTNEKLALENLEGLLSETISMYLRSDVPYGAFLSGGVDSGLVTGLISDLSPHNLHTFTAGYENWDSSEHNYAREASQRFNTQHKEVFISPEMLIKILPVIIRHFGEPFSDSSAIPAFLVSELASRHVKMAFSGDGGDELFGGYNSYLSVYNFLNHRFNKFKMPLYRLFSKIESFNPFQALAQEKSRELFISHEKNRTLFTREELSQLLHCEQTNLHEFKFIGGNTNIIAQLQYQDLQTYLVDDVLTKMDRMSMAHSLEVRVPLLDHLLVEFAFSLPVKLKIASTKNGVSTKKILKSAARRFFPETFLERPKMGFGIPLLSWMQKELKPYISRTLNDRQNAIFQYINPEYTHQLVNKFYEGNAMLASKVWSLFMFSLWMDNR